MEGLREQNGGGGGERIYNSCRGEAGKSTFGYLFILFLNLDQKACEYQTWLRMKIDIPVASIFTSSPSFNPIAIDRKQVGQNHALSNRLSSAGRASGF